MPINFPSNPSLNQTYEQNSVTWTFNGTGWIRLSTNGYTGSAGVGYTGSIGVGYTGSVGSGYTGSAAPTGITIAMATVFGG